MQGNDCMSYLPARKGSLLFRDVAIVLPIISSGMVARLGSVPTSREETWDRCRNGGLILLSGLASVPELLSLWVSLPAILPRPVPRGRRLHGFFPVLCVKCPYMGVGWDAVGRVGGTVQRTWFLALAPSLLTMRPYTRHRRTESWFPFL